MLDGSDVHVHFGHERGHDDGFGDADHGEEDGEEDFVGGRVLCYEAQEDQGWGAESEADDGEGTRSVNVG